MLCLRCRLAELLEEKGVTPGELAEASGLPPERVAAYCDDAVDSVSLREAGMILSALGCTLAELFDTVTLMDDAGAYDDAPPMLESEWHSVCPVAPDGKHRWYKDLAVSNTVYQEFTCQACGRRVSLII